MREATWNLTELVNAVARELGSEWKAVDKGESRDREYLEKGDVRLHFHQSTYGNATEIGRVEVSGVYYHLAAGTNSGYRSPRDYGVVKYHENEPKIGVAVSRGAAVVAKEITRRLLGEVERITAEMKVKVAEALAYEAQSKQNAQRFAAALGGEVRHDAHGYGNGREVPVYANGNGAYISARVGGDSVRFEHFSVDYATALAIAEAIRARAGAEQLTL